MKMPRKISNISRYQTGAALFTVLIMLVALTIVSLTSLSSSLLELRMSSNQEAVSAAFQSAQAGIDATLANSSTTLNVVGVINNTNCFGKTGCNSTIASLPSPINASTNQITVTRLTEEACPPRTRDYATSCKSQHAVTFDIDSSFDATSSGQGKSELGQGYIQFIPATQDLNTATPTTAANN